MASCIHSLLAENRERKELAKRGFKFCKKCKGTGRICNSEKFKDIKKCTFCNGQGYFR